MRKTSWLLLIGVSLAGCGDLGGPSSGLTASDEPVTMIAGTYDIQRKETGSTDGKQSRPRTVRHDVVAVPDAQTGSWPEPYLPLILDRIEQQADDCQVYAFAVTGNQFSAKGECSSSDSNAKLEATFSGLRGAESFEIRVEGKESYGSGSDEHMIEFNNLYVGKRLTDAEVAELDGNGSSQD